MNGVGAELYNCDSEITHLADGRQSLRYYALGPCDGGCNMYFVDKDNVLQSHKWYPSAITLVNGNVAVVGESTVGLLESNEGAISNPVYELIKSDGSVAPTQ